MQIGILHSLGGCGSTVVAKCLSAMPDVIVIGETHPLALDWFDPAAQAREWYGMDIQSCGNWLDRIERIAEDAERHGKRLVIRDWTYRDFIGEPYGEPTYKLTTADLIGDGAEQQTALVRHPLRQWLSLDHRSGANLGSFMLGYLEFARLTSEMSRL